MESQARKILVVASRTATSARLMHEIEARAAAGGCRFSLLIPDATDREKANQTLNVAVPLMTRAARTPVKGLVGGPDAFEAVQNAVREGSFDEIIVSTLPKRVSRWLRRDHHPSRGAGPSGDGGCSQSGAGPDRRGGRLARMSLVLRPNCSASCKKAPWSVRAV